jgi:hypothetical protein
MARPSTLYPIITADCNYPCANFRQWCIICEQSRIIHYMHSNLLSALLCHPAVDAALSVTGEA